MKLSTSFIIVLLLMGCSNRNDKEISGSGTIEATEVTVSAKVGGQITQLLVNEGSNVKSGDTVAIIDRSNLDIQLKQAQANVAAAQAQYKLIVRGAREEDIVQAEANLKNAQDDLNRMEELFRSNSVTQKQLDDARTRFIVAQKNHEKLKRGALPEEIDAARARLNQARAQEDLLKKNISDCCVVAPVSGIVTHKAVEEGELVGQGSVLVTISKLDKVNLMIYVSEGELGHVRLRQEAEVKIDTYPDRIFHGKVVYVSPTAEFTPKNVQTKEDRTKLVFGVKIEVDNPDGALKAGIPADAILKVNHATSK